ncbi:hypothetical protein SL053_002619 [Flavobacterium psychrophilum]|nr:hypothetical protein [Flavobacterium psychrophilum]
MKSIKYILAFLFCASHSFAQPTGDFVNHYNGNTIHFGNILFENKELFLDTVYDVEFEDDKIGNRSFIEKKSKLSDFINIKYGNSGIKTITGRVKDDKIAKDIYIYKNDTMTIKIIKNYLSPLYGYVFIKNLNFMKGTYIIDLKEIFTKEKSKQNAYIENFPFNSIISPKKKKFKNKT